MLLAQGLGQLQQAARGFRDGVAAGDRNSQLVAPSSSVILHMMHFTLYFSLLRKQLISKKNFLGPLFAVFHGKRILETRGDKFCFR